MPNLLNFNRQTLGEYLKSLGEKEFRADQIIKWIHQCGQTDFSAMTNISKTLREYLIANAEVKPPEVIAQKISTDGTRKWLLKFADGNAVETVFIPEDERGTLCVSTQVGCALKCDFCATGEQGFVRNLTVGEIIGQLWIAVHNLLKNEGYSITNVVLMGMGEPLLNFDNVVEAVNLMLDDHAYGLSKYRVTISTSGIVPEIKRLNAVCKASLAVSLHAANDTLRNTLMPINKKYPLKELTAACKDYFKDEPRRKVTFEYIMLAGLNDSIDHAKQLVRMLSYVPCKINLIPFNPGADTNPKYHAPSNNRIDAFRQILLDAGFNTITRKPRGADINAACGQLIIRNDNIKPCPKTSKPYAA